MTLKEGIRIHSPSINLQSRITISNGTIRASLDQKTIESHFDDAYVPKEPWRSMTKEESDLLVGSYPGHRSSLELSIVKVPKKILDGFKNLDYSLIKENGLSDAMRNSVEYQQLLPMLKNYLTRYGRVEDVKIYGFTKGSPNLITTSKASQGDRYIGLHLDNWDGLPIDKRHLATNRISINIGSEERYFLFINLSAQAIYERLNRDENGGLSLKEGRFVGDYFMEKYPEYPVTRCKLSPGEAYMASTKNMIHDGCTLGTSAVDYTFVVRGNFTY